MKIAFQTIICALILILILTASCSPPQPAPLTSRVHHIVICWLKDSPNLTASGELIKTSKSFTSIPGVISVSAGPILPSDRPAVDSTFDIAVVITFENQKALTDYQNHPDHKKALQEKLIPLTEKITIYDFID